MIVRSWKELPEIDVLRHDRRALQRGCGKAEDHERRLALQQGLKQA
jgi:hypothetical protein